MTNELYMEQISKYAPTAYNRLKILQEESNQIRGEKGYGYFYTNEVLDFASQIAQYTKEPDRLLSHYFDAIGSNGIDVNHLLMTPKFTKASIHDPDRAFNLCNILISNTLSQEIKVNSIVNFIKK